MNGTSLLLVRLTIIGMVLAFFVLIVMTLVMGKLPWS